ncbi:STY4851/ECs_5259 family protein [Lonepinella sp. MS14436]|uniref:STY4851/ECs_5259 family protein n=1 Tax=Lonepinella sp. MS14436 TaxID=3003619 RepID=UPI0036DC95CB
MEIYGDYYLFEYLNKFLAKRGLSQVSGKPLYTYLVTKAEFYEFEKLLKFPPHFKPQNNLYWCALYCLYGSEWYRQKYRGEWSWDGIDNIFDTPIDANLRSKIIINGFRYWKREIAQYDDHRKSYLGSVFREGGLPYILLTQTDSRFQDLFRNILSLYSYNPQVLLDYHLLLPYLTYFPEALKGDVTLSLIIEMATKLIKLVDIYDLSNRVNPINYLNEHNADWREDFPIPFDESTADTFLAGLLISTVEEKSRKTRNIARYELAYKLIDKENVKFKLELILNKHFSFNSDSVIQGEWFTLFLYEGNYPLAELTSGYPLKTENNHIQVLLKSDFFDIYRKVCNCPLYLAIKQQGHIIYQEELSQSEINLDEMPFILNEFNELVGLGSVKKEAGLFHIMISSTATYQAAENSQVEILDSSEQWQYLSLIGDIWVYYDQEAFFISTKQNVFKRDVQVCGKTLPYYSPSGRPIYLGKPYINDTEHFHLDMNHSANLAENFGEHFVRVLDKNNQLFFRKKVSILPDGFSIKLLNNGSDPRTGRIRITCPIPFMVKILTGSVEGQLENISGLQKELTVSSQFIIEKLVIDVRINLFSSVLVEIPYPSSGALIFDADEKEVKYNQSLSISELLGARLKLYPDIDTSANYEILLKNGQNNQYAWQYFNVVNPLEISLYDFKNSILSLLASSANLDDYARMFISKSGKQLRQVDIKLYAADPRIENGVVYFDDIPKDNVQLQLLSLVSLNVQDLLFNEEIKGYVLPEHIVDPSLVVTSKTSKIQSRSCFISGAENVVIDGELQQVITKDPIVYQQYYADMIEMMANDFTHSGWDYLKELYNRFNYLPLSTFSIWKYLVKNTRALVLFMMKANDVDKAMKQFQEEFNVIWEIIPIDVWNEMFDVFKLSLNVFSEGIQKVLLENRFNLISAFLCCFNYTKSDKQNDFDIEFMNNTVLPLWYDDMCRMNVNKSYWPTYFFDELQGWIREMNIPFNLKNIYHSSVVYMPFFAAAMAVNKVTLERLNMTEPSDFFNFRQLMEFEYHSWFKPVYQYAIQYFTENEKK